MTKHTPSPWQWWTSNSYMRLMSERYGAVAMPVVLSDGHPHIRVKKADADLIAAAPDLLAALEAILDALDFVEWTDTTNIAFDRATAAIAKAKGEEV